MRNLAFGALLQLAIVLQAAPLRAGTLNLQSVTGSVTCQVAAGQLRDAVDALVTKQNGPQRIADRLGLPLEATLDAKAGGMNVAVELRSPAGAASPLNFPDTGKIPKELRGQPVDGWFVKLEKAGAGSGSLEPEKKLSAMLVQAREETALRDLPVASERLQKEGFDIQLAETHVSYDADGTRVLFQRKAPGKKVTAAAGDVFGGGLKNPGDINEQRALVRALSDDAATPCFTASLAAASVSEVCRKLMARGIDLSAVSARLQTKAGESFAKTLKRLRSLAEGKDGMLPSLRTATGNLSLENRMFWEEKRKLVKVLDLSEDNFFVEVTGDHVRVNIFDP